MKLLEDLTVLWGKHHLDFNVKAKSGCTPAHDAAQKGVLPALQVLIKATGGECIDISVTTNRGYTVYDLARINQNTDIQRTSPRTT